MKFSVSDEQDGRILRNILQSDYKISRRLLRQLVQTDGVRRNGEITHLTSRAHRGDIINITLPVETSAIPAAKMRLDIRFEDSEIVVVNKPPGVLTHPTAWEREGSLLSGLLNHLVSESAIPHCVHRLDRDTSGLVLFAKHAHAHHLFDIALQTNRIRRGYTALVHLPTETVSEMTEYTNDWQTISLPIAGDRNQPSRRIISADGQAAVTHWRLLVRNGSIGMIQLSLETGRTHQIRLHMAATGMPIIGDPHYDWSYCMIPAGGERVRIAEEFTRLSTQIRRQALHAYRLEWTHPLSKESREVIVEPPQDFQSVMNREGLSGASWKHVVQKLISPPFAPAQWL